jgi:hypothetical protein
MKQFGMKRFGTGLFLCGTLSGWMLLAGSGCGGDETATDVPTTGPVVASPAGAPTYGEQSGMGFSTGDAIHSSGSGSGLAGYNGTGKAGTSSAISDTHVIGAPTFPTTQPVLPAP